MTYKCQFCPKELDNELQRIFHEQLHENELAPHKYENRIGYDICRFCGNSYKNEVHLKQYERSYPHELITDGVNSHE